MAQRTPWFWRSEFGCAKAPLATINLKTVKRSPRLTGNAAKVLLPLALSNGARLMLRATTGRVSQCRNGSANHQTGAVVYALLLVTRGFRGTPRRLGYPTLLKMCERMAAQWASGLCRQSGYESTMSDFLQKQGAARNPVRQAHDTDTSHPESYCHGRADSCRPQLLLAPTSIKGLNTCT